MAKTPGRLSQTLTARPVASLEQAAMTAALAAADLPIDDLREPGRDFFAFRNDTGTVVGYAGIEVYGTDALLRSVVTLPDARHRGYGLAIGERMAAIAKRRGVRALYALTTTAAPFFERLGFRTVEKTEAPPAIAGTTEFRALCPSTAVFLRREIV